MPVVTAFIFEGGQAAGPVSRDLQRLRDAMAPRLVGLWEAAGARVVLVSDRLEAAVERTSADFHFGRVPRDLLRRYPSERAIVMGGAALPPLRAAAAHRVLARLERTQSGFFANNLFSPDSVAAAPAAALPRMDPPDTDNPLGLRLLDLGLPGHALADRARFKFDLDTVPDAATLATDPECPRELAAALPGLPWLPPLVARAVAIERALATPRAEIAIIGGVGAHVLAHIDRHLRCQTRVVAEERGMRALGRERAGRVRSLIGAWVDAVGPRAFFASLGQEDAVLIDDRVRWAHWRLPLTEEDRLAADAGQLERVADGRLRAFVQAGWEAASPAPLGGHSLVDGGLWRMAERAAA